MSATEQLAAMKLEHGFLEPDRGDLDDPSIEWRSGKPDYTLANLQYFKGKTMNHAAGSLEKLVEDLVKTWEMEASHKPFRQWNTVEHSVYSISANGGKVYRGEAAAAAGNYNVLLDSCQSELYDSSKETFESSHHLFRQCFGEAFPWEVLQVFSGPPKVVFTWRHWGKFTGSYKTRAGDGQLYEMHGICEVKVNAGMKIVSIEAFYKPDEYLEALEGKRDRKCLGAYALAGNTCPFVNNSN